MKKTTQNHAISPFKGVAYFLFSALLLSSGCKKIQDHKSKVINNFEQVNLVANNNKYHAARIDPKLLNAWGLAFSPNGIAWISSEGAGVSTVYDKEGLEVRPPVAIPSPGAPTGGHPTGVVFNGSADFVLSNGQPARFIFVGDDGVLSGWNGAAGNTAIKVLNNSATSVYLGLALANDGGANFLYAANFKTSKIDVFDKNFAQVMTKPFKDPAIPAGYAPFNIQTIGDKLYVMYAKVAANGDEQVGAGLGYVDIYNTNGTLVKRFASKGPLNAPWGVAQVSASFFDDDLKSNESKESGILVGNFGDGRINVYTMDGKFVGQLGSHGHAIEIEGLWAISFPPVTATTIDPNRLYFTAGPEDEVDGLFGYIKMKN